MGPEGYIQAFDSYELKKKRSQKAIQTTVTRQKFKPSPNLYRSWSIGLYNDSWFRGFTVLVILVQTLGPLFLLGYARRHYQHKIYVSTAEDFHARYCIYQEVHVNRTSDLNNNSLDRRLAKGGSPNQARHGPGHGAEDIGSVHSKWHPPECTFRFVDLFDWLDNDNETWRLITQKILGSIFIILIFLSNDRTLLSQDLEVDNLTRLFPFHSRGWLLADALCNSASFTVIGICIGPLLSSAETVSSVVLDSISLLFIGHLDNLGADLDFGLNCEDFEYVVEHQRKDFVEEHKQSLAEVAEQEDSEDSESEDRCGCCGITALKGPELIVTLARMFNFGMLCVQLPFYAFTSPVENEELLLAFDEGWHGRHERLRLCEVWLPWSFVIWLIVMVSNTIRFFVLPAAECHIDEKDFEGFFSLVIFRRPGSRYQKRVSLDSLLHED